MKFDIPMTDFNHEKLLKDLPQKSIDEFKSKIKEEKINLSNKQNYTEEDIFKKMFENEIVSNEFKSILKLGQYPTIEVILNLLNDTKWYDRYYLSYSIEDGGIRKHNLYIRINYTKDTDYHFEGASLKELLLTFYIKEKYNLLWDSYELKWNKINEN